MATGEGRDGHACVLVGGNKFGVEVRCVGPVSAPAGDLAMSEPLGMLKAKTA